MNRPPLATIDPNDLRAREQLIRRRILDSIEETLDENPCAVPSAQSAK